MFTLPKYVKRRVPVETYERFERYAKRLGIGIIEATDRLFEEFFREVPPSVAMLIMELEGIEDGETAFYKCFNKWFDEKYGVEIEEVE